MRTTSPDSLRGRVHRADRAEPPGGGEELRETGLEVLEAGDDLVAALLHSVQQVLRSDLLHDL